MKRIFTLGLLSIVLCYQQANAQLGKGQLSLGGSFAASTSKATSEDVILGTLESKSNGFSINPQLSVGVGRNWMIGLRPGFGFSKGTFQDNGVTESKGRGLSFSIAALARKFYPLGERFGLFGQGVVQYGGNYNKNLMTGIKNESRVFDIYVNPGAYLKATKRFILETTIGSIGYESSTFKPSNASDSKSKGHGFGISLSNNISFGFHVTL